MMEDRKRLRCLHKEEGLYNELLKLMNILPESSEGGGEVLAEQL